MTLAVALLLTLTQGQLDLAGKPLAEALLEIQARGVTIVFSADLVRPDMKVREQPKSTRLTDIVNEILAPHGLTTRPGENGALIVVLRFTESVDVTSTAPVNTGRPPIEVPAARVVAMAGGLENIFHTLQLLPGVTATSDFGSRQSVRGGGPDENLIVMDHIELHNPYRLFDSSAASIETVQQFSVCRRIQARMAIDCRRCSSSTRATGRRRNRAGPRGVSIDTNIVVEGRYTNARADRGW